MMSQYQVLDVQHSQATDLNDIHDHMRTLFTRLALQVALVSISADVNATILTFPSLAGG